MTISSIPKWFVFINFDFLQSLGNFPTSFLILYYFFILIILKRADEALDVIEAASTGSLGEVCVNSAGFKSLPADVVLDSRRYDTARQKTDMTARILQNFRVAEAMQRNGELELSCIKKTNFKK